MDGRYALFSSEFPRVFPEKSRGEKFPKPFSDRHNSSDHVGAQDETIKTRAMGNGIRQISVLAWHFIAEKTLLLMKAEAL